MKPSQSMEQRQKLALLPQMRQSLELLQLPLAELKDVIRAEVESNPVIDNVEMPQEVVSDTTEIGEDDDVDGGEGEVETWEERPPRISRDEDERIRYAIESVTRPESLSQYLERQLSLADVSDAAREYGPDIIGNIGDDGFLSYPDEDLALMAKCPLEVVAEVRRALRDFDPPGIGARDLRDCLLIQLEGMDSPEASLAQKIVSGSMEDLAAGNFDKIAAALGVDRADVDSAVALIRTLDPRPAQAYDTADTEYVDVEIAAERGRDGVWRARLVGGELPTITLSEEYERMAESDDTPAETRSYLAGKIRDCRNLVKGMRDRNETMLSVAAAIVAAQQDFFEKGVSHLRPMKLADIAERVGMHETTVSRACANKYMRTPFGVFELRYFFSTGVSTAAGSVSNKAVQDKIKEYVLAEDPSNPLSDPEIVEKLKADGIDIARRTVTKYRKLQKIPACSERRTK